MRIEVLKAGSPMHTVLLVYTMCKVANANANFKPQKCGMSTVMRCCTSTV